MNDSSPCTHLARVTVVLLACLLSRPASAADLTLLFLGDNGHHRPAVRFQELAPALEKRGIDLKYTDRMQDLNPQVLGRFDGLVLYANIDRIEDAQAKAVLDFVAAGNGFIPLHCATYCWRNNPAMVALMGGQFQRHGGRVFTTQVADPEHPIMKGYGSFTSWDETYIHHLHNERNRTVLEYRVEGGQAPGRKREPWTWVRTHEKGRVFYTAWGHDQRTFAHPGFHNLVERGIRWACGDDPAKVPRFHDPDRFAVPALTAPRKDVAKFEYLDVGPKIPNYTPGKNWGTQGQPRNRMQQPLPSGESIKHFVTPEGMAVRLYADEKSFGGKPIAMNWDERGRLWVCETVDYPNELGGNRDRIRICEDTDGNHVADKFTVFADRLSIPTAIAIVRGGAVVQNGTETIYLKDTDGDDVCDRKTTLITGWSLGDTHGGVSNFRYGLDNWIWAMQGYNNSTPHVDGKPVQSFRMGFWRFKLSQTDPPRVTELEFIRSSNNNTWGLGISEEGLIFGSTANHNPSMFVPIPNRYYERVRGWSPSPLGSIADTHEFHPITANIRQVDHHGGYTAGSGHALYTARAFPPAWWNRTAFVCGPTGHLVGTFLLRRDGANYTSTSPVNLLASDDEWSAPIMAEVGPDGAVWVIDWYNYIVQHNPTPQGFQTGKGRAYESDLRDKKHGRIYRVVATSNAGDTVHPFSNLTVATNEQLVRTLQHPSFAWRLHAQRLLVERQANDIASPLTALLRDEGVDEIGLNVGAIHALWTAAGLGLLTGEETALQQAAFAAVHHPSPGVRRAALSVLPPCRRSTVVIKTRNIAQEPDPQVKLAAILAMADMPPGKSAAVDDLVRLAAADEIRRNSILSDALTAAAAQHDREFLHQVSRDEAARSHEKTLAITTVVAEHVARGRPTVARITELISNLEAGGQSFAAAVLQGLSRGWPDAHQIEIGDRQDAAVLKLLKGGPRSMLSAAAKSQLVKLATRWGSERVAGYSGQLASAMLKTVGDAAMSDDERAQAASQLVSLQPDSGELASQLIASVSPQMSLPLSLSIIDAVAASRAESAGRGLTGRLSELTPRVKSAAIATLLSRPAWAKSLLDAVAAGKFDLDELSLEQKQTLRAFPDSDLRARAEKLLALSGGLPDADRDKVLTSLLPLTQKKGDVDAGLATFKKVCAACHKHGDIGHTVGPNLTGMAVHPKAELLTHIIDPSRSVEGNFRVYTVITADGLVINGMLASETRTSLTIIDAKAKEHRLPREDIDELVPSRKSLMPDGFEKQITAEELTNLLEFLTNKGRFVPLPVDRVATAISTKALFHDNPDDGPDRLIFADWRPKMFKGIPFVLTDPLGKSRPNIVLLHGPNGTLPPRMPRSVVLPCNTSAKAIHLLGGVSGWGFPATRSKSVSLIVRLHYADGTTEDHKLLNGVHIADYIRRVDVPESEFAFKPGGQQVRYLSISPRRPDRIESIALVKGTDQSSPIVMAVTVERQSGVR